MAKNEIATGCVGCLAISLMGFCACSGFLMFIGQTTQIPESRNAVAGPPDSKADSGNVTAENVRPNTSPAESAPREVDYQVTIDQDRPPIKRVVYVHLPYRVTEAELKSIALKLKNQAGAGYQRIFIMYFLPGMKPGEGAWATSHFDPGLAINILGSTIETESALLKLSTNEPIAKDYIGQWKDSDGPGSNSFIRIFRDNGKFYLEKIFTDGISKPRELVAFLDSGTVRFVVAEELDPYLRRLIDAEYWELQKNGELAICGIERGIALRYSSVPTAGNQHTANLSELPTIGDVRERHLLKPLEPVLPTSTRNKLEAVCAEVESMLNDLAMTRTTLLQSPATPSTLEKQGTFARDFRQRIDHLKSELASIKSKGASPVINFDLHFALVELVGAFDWLNLTTKDLEYAKSKDRLRPKLQAIREELARHRPAGSVSPSFRTWTSADGLFRTEAKFISFLNGRIELEKSNGVRIKVDIETLSDVDQEFVRAHLKSAN